MSTRKRVFCYVLAFAMISVGILHFANPTPFLRIMPRALPAPLALVYISGVFEILGGLGLLLPRTRIAAAWGLIVLYVAVFPANINMAVNHLSLSDQPTPNWIAWARLPFQALFIAWAYWMTRKDERTEQATVVRTA